MVPVAQQTIWGRMSRDLLQQKKDLSPQVRDGSKNQKEQRRRILQLNWDLCCQSRKKEWLWHDEGISNLEDSGSASRIKNEEEKNWFAEMIEIFWQNTGQISNRRNRKNTYKWKKSFEVKDKC